jgi:hypothetical protein
MARIESVSHAADEGVLIGGVSVGGKTEPVGENESNEQAEKEKEEEQWEEAPPATRLDGDDVVVVAGIVDRGGR